MYESFALRSRQKNDSTHWVLFMIPTNSAKAMKGDQQSYKYEKKFLKTTTDIKSHYKTGVRTSL